MVAMWVPMILVGAFALVFPRKVTEKFQDAIGEGDMEIFPAIQLQTLIHRAIMPPNNYLGTGDPSEAIRFNDLATQVDAGFDQLRRISFDVQRERELVQEAIGYWLTARRMATTLLNMPEPVGNPEAARVMARMDDMAGHAVKALGEMLGVAQSEKAKDLAGANDLNRRTKKWVILTAAVELGIGVCLMPLFARGVDIPLLHLSEGARRFGEGDLAHRIQVETGDELELLAAEFNRMAAALSENHTALKHLAIHDGLTGLINHREFYLRLNDEYSKSKRHQRPMSLLMLDVDHFKKFNDTYGHQRGDLVLRLIAKILRTSVRQSDLVARYGGEEFAILLSETPLQEGLALGLRIQESLADSGHDLTGVEGERITVSIGAAAYPMDATTAEGLVQVADRMLYRAKNRGRNRICATGDGSVLESLM